MRTLMIGVTACAGVAAIVFWSTTHLGRPPGFPAPHRIHDAALRQVPDLIVTSVRPEVFNELKAWEVRGTAKDGTVWLIDILDSGEVVMYEPIEHHPPPNVMVPIPEW